MGSKRWVGVVVLVITAVVIMRTQFLDTMTVSSASMAPTLCTEDTVMADNRGVSIDSRRFGAIPTADIAGRLLTDLSLTCHS